MLTRTDNFKEAYKHYHLAAENDVRGDPEAMFNIGWMHHIGVGMSRDLGLAKRYYDRSRRISQHAKAPANTLLAILWLEKELSIVFPFELMRWFTLKFSEGGERYIKEERMIPSKFINYVVNAWSSIIDVLGSKDNASLWTMENIILTVAFGLLVVIVVYRQHNNLF